MKKLVFLLASAIVSACGSAESSTSTESGLIDTRATWSNPSSIPVCIVNPSEVSAELVDDVQNWVTEEYARKTQINFIGWGTCTSRDMSAKMIRVRFRKLYNWSGNSMQAGAGQSKVGPSSTPCATDCGQGTMRLDIGSTGRYPTTSSWAREFAIRLTRDAATHEFGHAIGLKHEHERTDADPCGSYTTKVTNAGWNVYTGSYDEDSVMNYCNPNRQGLLSAGDVDAIETLYN